MNTHYHVGDSCVIFSVPHDGGIEHRHLPMRSEGQRWADEGFDARDVGTLEIAQLSARRLRLQGNQPTIVWFDLHRFWVDVNRSPDHEPCSQGLQDAYEEYHALLDRLIQRSLARYGRCLLVDIHGYDSTPAWNGFDVVLGSNSHETCPNNFDRKVASHLARRSDVASRRGIRVAFSPDPSVGLGKRFRGGWIVRRTANRYGASGLESLQIEFHERMRREDTIHRSAICLAEAIGKEL